MRSEPLLASAPPVLALSKSDLYLFLADVILVVHFAFVAFVVLGLVFIWIGYFLGLRAVRNPWFRVAHLLAMGVVVAQALWGVICPLTIWENELREAAGGAERYESTFMQHWLHRILFFEWSPATFTIVYVVFFLALVASLIVVRPEWRKGAGKREEKKEEKS